MTAIDQKSALCLFQYHTNYSLQVCVENTVVDSFKEQFCALICAKQFVQYGKIKYIFLVGKNRFIVCGFRCR